MKITTLAILLGTLFSVSAWAGNGLFPIGQSTHTRAMGGTGVGHYTTSSGAIFKNMSLLSQDSSESKFALSVDVDHLITNFSVSGDGGANYVSPKRQRPFIPFITLGYKLNDDISLGGGVTFAGAAMDWSDVNIAPLGLVGESNTIFMDIPLGMSYKIGEKYSLGVAAVVSTLSLSKKYLIFDETASSTSVGFDLSGSAKINEQISAGFSYRSKIAHKASDFDFDFDTVKETLEADMPAQAALGMGYSVNENLSLAFDWRMIQWADTKYFGDLGWEDQNVFALGAEYKTGKKLNFRLGYNHANTPIEDNLNENITTTSTLGGETLNQAQVSGMLTTQFINAGTSHVTWGFGYEKSENMNLNLAIVHLLEKEVARTDGATGNNYFFKNKVSQVTIMAGMDFNF